MKRERPATFRDLDLLGQYWPILFGKALDPEHLGSIIGKPPPVSGRPDYVDEASPKLSRAILALDTLYRLAERGPRGRKQAATIAAYYSVCGPGARLPRIIFPRIAECWGAEPLGPEPQAYHAKRKGAARGELVEIQRGVWRRWETRRAALEKQGRAYLKEAEAAWDALHVSTPRLVLCR